MADFCMQCTVEDHLWDGLDAFNYSECGDLAKVVEPGQLYQCICEGCGPTVVDHEGRCLGKCLRAHGDLPVPTFDMLTTLTDDYCLA